MYYVFRQSQTLLPLLKNYDNFKVCSNKLLYSSTSGNIAGYIADKLVTSMNKKDYLLR